VFYLKGRREYFVQLYIKISSERFSANMTAKKIQYNMTVSMIPTANSDGLLNCLCQPRLLLHQPQKFMRENLHPLFNLLPPGLFRSSGTESVGLAAIAHGVMVFASPSRLFHRVPGLTILTRTWYLRTTSSCTRTLQPSARTGKNHATATQTATHQTAGPLCVIT
jgi:hypothetical protein